MDALAARRLHNARPSPQIEAAGDERNDCVSRSAVRCTAQHRTCAPPDDWSGPLRTPAFILNHVITHAFHHKGQVVAMFRLLGRPASDTDLQRS